MIVLPFTLEEARTIGPNEPNIHRDIVLHRASQAPNFGQKHGAAYEKAWRDLNSLLARVERQGESFIKAFRDGKTTFPAFRGQIINLLRTAYDKAYELGLHATGASRQLARVAIDRVSIEDRQWLNTSFQEEIKYLDNFLRDIQRGRLNRASYSTGTDPVSSGTLRGWNHRLKMYITSIGSVFYSGRIQGIPPNYIVLWVSKLDARTCPQCRYMATQAPFSKYNLPIVPGNGMTVCKGNCRCKLILRQVDADYFNEIASKSVSRETHLRKLKAAKV